MSEAEKSEAPAEAEAPKTEKNGVERFPVKCNYCKEDIGKAKNSGEAVALFEDHFRDCPKAPKKRPTGTWLLFALIGIGLVGVLAAVFDPGAQKFILSLTKDLTKGEPAPGPSDGGAA